MTFVNYDGKGLTSPGKLEVGGDKWFRVYNNTGADIANGAIYEVGVLVEISASEFADATSANPVVAYVLYPPATSIATSDQDKTIVVVDNFTDADSELKDNKFGWAKYEGVCKALCLGDATAIVANEQLEVLNDGTAFIKSAAATSASQGLVKETVAIAMETYTTASNALKYVHLLGRQVTVKAS
jgi:hypothetical protein